MKKLVVLLALLPSLAPAQEKVESELVGTLRFANRDRLSGKPEGFDADGNLKWQASFLHEPIPIRPSKILEMRLQGGGSPNLDVDHQALLTLTKDRKSTRLNSSHALISYAVFCLKKKIGRAHV